MLWLFGNILALKSSLLYNPGMRIFIDFDDVIFNTGQFKHDFKAMFIANGVPSEVFDKYYNDPNDKRIVKTFNPWRQIENINSELGLDAKKLTDLVNCFIADMSSYVFGDVENFVSTFGGENISVISFGEKEFQTKKIKNSNIEKLIKNIVVTDESKSHEISKILVQYPIVKGENIFFLDDRIEQIREIKERFPSIITIFIKRPEGRYQEMCREECCNIEVHNLKEARGIIEKYEQEN